MQGLVCVRQELLITIYLKIYVYVPKWKCGKRAFDDFMISYSWLNSNKTLLCFDVFVFNLSEVDITASQVLHICKLTEIPKSCVSLWLLHLRYHVLLALLLVSIKGTNSLLVKYLGDTIDKKERKWLFHMVPEGRAKEFQWESRL